MTEYYAFSEIVYITILSTSDTVSFGIWQATSSYDGQTIVCKMAKQQDRLELKLYKWWRSAFDLGHPLRPSLSLSLSISLQHRQKITNIINGNCNENAHLLTNLAMQIMKKKKKSSTHTFIHSKTLAHREIAHLRIYY